MSDEQTVRFEGGELKIGRNHGNDVVLDDLNVSRFHAVDHPQRGQVIELRDLHSACGTRLNGRPIKRAVVTTGDEIGIGPFKLLLRRLRLRERGPARTHAPRRAAGVDRPRRAPDRPRRLAVDRPRRARRDHRRQRRRQDDAAEDARRGDPPGRGQRLAERRPDHLATDRRRLRAAAGDHPPPAHRPGGPRLRVAAPPAAGHEPRRHRRRRSSGRSGSSRSRSRPRPGSTGSPAASASEPRSPPSWSTARGSCSSTSPPPASIPSSSRS